MMNVLIVAFVAFIAATARAAAGGAAYPVYATNYGVVCDGVTDDTAAMQAAHSTGRVVIYPAGQCKFSTLVIKGGGIVGESLTVLPGVVGATTFVTTDTGSGNSITFYADQTSKNPGVFRNFSLIPSDAAKAKPGGAALYIAGNVNKDGVVNYGTLVDYVWIRNFPIDLSFECAANYTVSNSEFEFYSIAGISIKNSCAPDQGGSTIYANQFFNGVDQPYGSQGAGILQSGGGGLKVASNVFNGGAYGYQWRQGKFSTSDLIITGNNFENASSAAVDLQNTINTTSNLALFYNIIVTGNEFALNHRDVYLEPIANSSATGAFWKGVQIGPNIHHWWGASSGGGSATTAVEVATAWDVGVEGTFTAEEGSGSPVSAVAFDSSVVSGSCRYFITANSAFSAPVANGANCLGLVMGNANGVSALSLGPGAATQAPLQYRAGGLLTTPAAGATEYDGTVFYTTTAANQRGLAPSVLAIRLPANYKLSVQTAPQKLFNAGNGALNLGPGLYKFRCMFGLTGLSPTLGNYNFGFGGTASITQAWTGWATKTDNLFAPSVPNVVYGVYWATISPTNTSTQGSAQIEGTLSVASAGTVIPQVGMSTAAAAVVRAGAYCEFYQLGSPSFARLGNWN